MAETKLCKTCKEVKPLCAFSKMKASPDGYKYECKECKKVSGKAYRTANKAMLAQKAKEDRVNNPEKFRLRGIAYRQKNKEQIATYHRELYKNNRAEVSEKHRKYYEDNRDECLAYGKAYYEANKATIAKRHRKYAMSHPAVIAAADARRRARERGLSVIGAEVTGESIEARWAMWGGKCWICGDSAEATDHVKPLFHNGLNIPANLRPICKRCNSIKGRKWPYVKEVA